MNCLRGTGLALLAVLGCVRAADLSVGTSLVTTAAAPADRLRVKPPQATIPLEELARSRRVDLQKIVPPQDRMKDYGGQPKQCEVEIRPDTEYGQAAGESLRLDLYLPKGLSGAR